MSNPDPSSPTDFIRTAIKNDLGAGKNNGQVVTRFPPEPNGYLHIGHAKSICLNFGIANEFHDGQCFLRFDDTNPVKESPEFVASIQEDVRWLGYDWGDRLRYASQYFEALYQNALGLIKHGKAYVCSLNADEMRANRGTLTEPGVESPYRNRSIDENLSLFTDMRAGNYADGEHVLRAKIDMSSPNLNLRDPVIYRIRKVSHQMTGNEWCVYPMYDYAHCLSDSIEGITHSLCTLEFEDHRPLYNWFLEQSEVSCHPQQIEFSRLSLNYTVMSKRLLNQLVEEKHVSGWNDPRMPTISGLRRRGYTPESIRDFCERIGVTKKDNNIEMGVLENSVREHLDEIADRVMGVLRPLKVVIENYPDDLVEEFDAKNHPNYPDRGSRKIPFSKTLYIEADDFMENPAKKFFRLGPGREVRLRYAYFITCVDVIKDESGAVVELRCTYDPASRGGSSPDGRKVKGTIHWVSAEQSVTSEVRLYDRLFMDALPLANKEKDFLELLNDNSIERLLDARLEPCLAEAQSGAIYQFERQGYFCVDTVDSSPGTPVFNRTVTLRDAWAKIEKNNARK